MKLSTQPYKGTRDFYPEDMAMQKYIFSIMRQSAEQFGYNEYDAPMLEEASLYKAKTGDEIVNEQTYTFTDRGDREVTIRPEMTPSLARMIAAGRKSLLFPVRWYSIPNLWRYEQPQRGRLREHWQLNVDFIGSDSPHADAEIISIADAIMKNFGAQADQYAIKINNRKLMNTLLFDYFKLNDETAHKVTKLIDRKEKMPQEKFLEALTELVGAEGTEQIVNLFNDVNEKGIAGLPEELQQHESAQELILLFNILTDLHITNYVFDLTLMRGFDYYTGVVFEVFDTNPVNKRSIFGGGRYDELVGIFDVEPIPAIGFGMGDVVIKDFLETYNLLPEFVSTADIYICTFGEEYILAAQQFAQNLRAEGIHVAVDLSSRKIQKQIATADKKNIPYIICIGEDEVQNSHYKLKNLETGNEQEVSLSDIIDLLG